MLLRCPKCGDELAPAQLRPRSGTAICPTHGEVRPRVAHPALGENASREPSPDWSARWSQRGSSYRLEALIHPSMGASFAPLAWENTWGFVSMDAATMALSVPLFALTYVPRLFTPRLVIDRRRIRFGPRFRRLRVVNDFHVRATRRGSSELALDENLDEPLVILECSRPADVLRGLADMLNEALFVVRQAPPPPLPEPQTPYR